MTIFTMQLITTEVIAIGLLSDESVGESFLGIGQIMDVCHTPGTMPSFKDHINSVENT